MNKVVFGRSSFQYFSFMYILFTDVTESLHTVRSLWFVFISWVFSFVFFFFKSITSWIKTGALIHSHCNKYKNTIFSFTRTRTKNKEQNKNNRGLKPTHGIKYLSFCFSTSFICFLLLSASYFSPPFVEVRTFFVQWCSTLQLRIAPPTYFFNQ